MTVISFNHPIPCFPHFFVEKTSPTLSTSTEVLKEIPIKEQDKMMVLAGGLTRLPPDIANDRLPVLISSVGVFVSTELISLRFQNTKEMGKHR
ncbi:hypothetical protein VAEKB19_1020002 [Vibrio aestuarianus]|nr:hypothetical protein VAEKB19_1020002 [Vibrio aestuarianus]